MFDLSTKKIQIPFSIKEFSVLLVYIALALLAISDSGIQLFILMEIGPGSRTLRLIAMWLLFTKVLMTRYTKKEFFLLAPFAILAMYNYYRSGNIYCVYTILVIAAMKDVDYSILFKVLFYSTLTTIIFLGILSYFGIGSPIQMTQNFGRDVVETRYCFGLYNPNIWHHAIARCIIFGCIGHYKQLNVIHILILLVFNYFIFKMSVSRTGLLAVSIVLILFLFYRYFPRFMHFILIKLCAIAGMLAVYGVFLYYSYDYYLFNLPGQLFDYRLTTGRINQALIFLKEHPILAFSSRFPDDGTLFDCGFYRVFYECGYLWASLFFLVFFTLVIVALKKNWDVIIPVMVYFIFYSLYEFDPITRPTYNIPVFFFALLVFDSLSKGFDDFMLSCQKVKNPKPSPSSKAR